MISILLPLYNGENFLEEAIESIKKQTYKEWVLYIGVNGHGLGSDTFKRVKHKFEADNILVFEFDLKSKPLTLNKLCEYVKTEHIALIDVDDTWDPEKLEKQMKYKDKYDIIGTLGRYIGDKKGKIDIEKGEISYNQIFFHNCVINSSVIMKKKFYTGEDVLLDDYNLWFCAIEQGATFYNLPEILTNHRVHNDSHFNHINNDHVMKLKEKWVIRFGEKGNMKDRLNTTVILPLLSNETYHDIDLKQTIDSVLSQTFKGYELIIVVSEEIQIEQVRRIMNKYSDEDKIRIQIKKLTDKKVEQKKLDKMSNRVRARYIKMRINRFYDKCMKLGKYKLIAFIHPRDMWLPGKLGFQVMWMLDYINVHGVNGEFWNESPLKGKRAEDFNLSLPKLEFDKHAIMFYRSGLLLRRSRFGAYPRLFGRKEFFYNSQVFVKIHCP